MQNQIERAIDLAAITMIAEMYPNDIDVLQISDFIQKIIAGVDEQPSAEMLINYLAEKYK